MELNTDKINNELNRLGKTINWLANEAGRSRQIVYYWVKTKSLKGAEPIGKVLDIEPRDLIK